MLKARAAEVLRELVDLTGIHVVTTLMARGVFPDSHPLNLGMPGMHGNAYATTAMQKSDLLIALGARFDDRITGKVDTFAPDAKIIHVDIDPAEQGKVRKPDVPIVGDCRLVTEELVKAIRDLREGGVEQPDLGPWKSRISGWQEQFPTIYEQSRAGRGAQAAVLPRAAPRRRAGGHDPRLGRRTAPDVVVAALASSTSPTPGSTRVGSARWGSRSRPRSAPRSAVPTARCGPSTATAASR